jgi:hypothetical protein
MPRARAFTQRAPGEMTNAEPGEKGIRLFNAVRE